MGKVKTILKAAGITMGVMFIMDKAQNANPTIFKITGPRQTAIARFLDYITFWN
jgi:hypothetical protein